jgi:hypothetical protein
VARLAALRRWIRVRFGAAAFASLGAPGGALVDQGIADLVRGRETVEALVISLAAPRLKREGVPLPRALFEDADRRLYRLLEKSEGKLAHLRYLAYLAQVSSFADALAGLRGEGGGRAA